MPTEAQRDRLRSLPAVDELLASSSVEAWAAEHPRAVVIGALRTALDAARRAILEGDAEAPAPDELAEGARRHAAAMARPSLRRALNATGIIVHTGLGRSRLADAAIQAILDCAGYCNLELDLDSGDRGSRHVHLESLLCELTGAEAALAVNNNAAAVMLALNTIADGLEVIVSRGHLIEIGGSFRLPTIMAKSGCRLVEVGTTNRTRLEDYRNALTPQTAAILKVHTSNFRLVGFVEETPPEELAHLAHEWALEFVEDLGSGALLDTSGWLGEREPTCQDSLRAGADLVCFSGDKLLGGPQAGLVVGRRGLIEDMKRNPLTRAVRLDKLTIAALAATLMLYRDPERAVEAIPTLRAATEPIERVQARAERLAELIAPHLDDGNVEILESEAAIGGGALPGQTIPSRAVAVLVPGEAGVLARNLRRGDPPVIARVQRDQLLLDCRTLTDEELPELANALHAAVVDAVAGSAGVSPAAVR